MNLINFKEYLETQEDIALFKECDEIDENWMNAAISGVGNTGVQLGRGIGNFVGGVYNTGVGVAQTGIGAAQGLGGGFNKGRSNINKGIKRAAGGVGQGLLGAAQAFASPISGIVRAAQASDEDFSTKMAPDRNSFQKAFGLNSWDAKEKQDSESQQKDTQSQEEEKSREFAKHLAAYKIAKTEEEKANAVQGMRQSHKEKFDQLRKEGEKRRAAKIAQNREDLRRKAMSGNSSMRVADEREAV